MWSLTDSGVEQLKCVCVCVFVSSLLKNNGPKIDYADRGFSMFTSFHAVSISTHVIGMLTHVSEATAIRQNWSSGRCNVSRLHNHKHAWRRKDISGCRVEQSEEEFRISTVSVKTHLYKLQATDPTFMKKLS
jgi:hypothetical protein